MEPVGRATPSPQTERRVNATACKIASKLWGGSWRALKSDVVNLDDLDDFRASRVSAGEEKAA